MAEVLGRIRPPSFRNVDFPITSYGAHKNTQTECRAEIMEAINHCNAAGGGRVIVPAGEWRVSGPVHLKSNVNLHLERGATLRFNPDPELYLPMVMTRWEGVEIFNYSPLVYAYQSINVAVTGKGMIDGNAKESFASWKPKQGDAQARLREMGASGVPLHKRVFGKDNWLRPSTIQFFECRNVLVEGISVVDAPFWVIHPVYCQNVTIREIHVDSWNQNNDGVDVDSCVDILIEDCIFETGDDNVAVKSGRDQDGWRVGQASENVIIRGCDLRSETNGLCIGSEMSGGVRNVFMQDCRIGQVNSAIFFKSNLDRGGVVERIRVSDIAVEAADTLIHFTTDYHGYRGGNHPPTFRDFVIENAVCKQAGTAIDAVGVPTSPLMDITLRDITVSRAENPNEIRHVENFTLEDIRINDSLVSVDLQSTTR